MSARERWTTVTSTWSATVDRGDVLFLGDRRVIVTRVRWHTLTIRPYRWYDTPRLWLRALPSRIRRWCERWLARHFAWGEGP